MGQTGRSVLSDEMIQYKKEERRTVRYRYKVMKYGTDNKTILWRCEVIGPFHSRTYGVCGFGTTKKRSKVNLERRLANDYRYIGNLMFSDVDEADTVGIPDDRLWELWIQNRPISKAEAVGSAGL